MRQSELDCDYAQLADVHLTVDEVIFLIDTYITMTLRVPPLLIARLFRGGKTTLLKAVFTRLSESSRDTLPIIITLNDGFGLRNDESLMDGVLRTIACQFVRMERNETPITFKCDSVTSLLNYIDSLGYSRVVLIVDELNRFGLPVDPELSTFLKVNFLDKKNYYLVFSSHQPLDIEAVRMTASQLYLQSAIQQPGGSGRSVVLPSHLPQTCNLSELRLMPDCNALTQCEVSLYGGIPSLMYVAKHFNLLESPRNRFFRYLNENNNYAARKLTEHKQHFLMAFLRELRTGSSYIKPGEDDYPQVLDCFASHFKQEEQQIWYKSWPLCYIECILGWFGIYVITSVTQALIQYASEVDSGKDWECVIVAGVYISCLDAIHSPVVDGIQQCGPFNIADRGISGVTYATLPGDNHNAIRTIAQAVAYFHGLQMPDRHVLLATPCYAKFPDYDGFLCYGQPDGAPPTIVGFQCKKTRSYPKHPVPPEISRAVLLRGSAPLSNGYKQKWEYYGEERVREVLGWSLRHLFTADWGDAPSSDSFD